MPIQIELVDDLSCPFVVCDVCREKIEDAGMGLAAWVMIDEEGPVMSTSHLYFVHKGNCIVLMDKRKDKTGERVGTMEVTTMLEYLVGNMGRVWKVK